MKQTPVAGLTPCAFAAAGAALATMDDANVRRWVLPSGTCTHGPGTGQRPGVSRMRSHNHNEDNT
jgi:hypothetical protein